MQQYSYTLEELAKLTGAHLSGDANLLITGLNTLQNAGGLDISFLASPAYARYLNETKAGAVILSPENADVFFGNMLIVDNPYLGYAKVSHCFDLVKDLEKKIHSSALVNSSAEVHPEAAIGPGVVIESGVIVSSGVRIDAGTVVGHDSVIGKGTHLARNVTICHGITIGERVIVHSGAVIGDDGFGNVLDQGRWHKIAQIGSVIIENDVEIGSCTCIDRGALSNTVIGEGSRLDNLVQVAHNVTIGKNTAIAACVGIAGSAHIGNNCTIGGQAGINGHITIVDNVHIGASAMITRSISNAGSYASGTGFMNVKDWRKSVIRFRQLNDLTRRIILLEKK